MAVMSDPIQWRVFERTSPRVAWLVAGLLGLIVGPPIGLLASTALDAAAGTGAVPGLATRVDATAVGATAGALVLVATLVAATLSWYRRRREEAPLAEGLAIDAAGVRWLPLSGLAAGAVVALAPAVGSWLTTHLALASVAVGATGFVAVRALRGAGRYDPDSDTLSFQGRTFDLARAPTRPVTVGRLTLLVVRRPTPDPAQRYTVVPVPARIYAEIRRSVGRP